MASPLVVSMFVMAIIGLLLGAVMALYVTFRLPRLLEHERDRHPPGTNFAPVRLASTDHVDTAVRPVQPVDGVTPVAGDRVLLREQNDSSENGVWVVPHHMDEPWERARDMRNGKQLVDGATVFVTAGDGHRDATFVLRLLSRDRNPQPGRVDLYFLPILQHLFGPAHLPAHQVLRVNERGLATWNTPDLVARQTLAMMNERGWAHASKTPSSFIPEKIHAVYGMWGQPDGKMPEAWERNVRGWRDANPDFQVRVWTPEQCEELVRSEFPRLVDLYSRSAPVTRYNLVRWLVLYHEGGYFLDCDVTAKPVANLRNMWMKWSQPRMVLATESYISEHEAESLNRFSVRGSEPCEPGPRVATYFVAACQRHPFVHFVVQHVEKHSHAADADYDTVFASGTDAVSHVYNRYGRDFEDILLLSQSDADELMTHERAGTWKNSSGKLQ